LRIIKPEKIMQSPLYFFSVEEYLELEQTSDIRHEYFAGEVFAMAGGSKEHNIITLNIASRLRSRLRGSSCNVFMSDMKVRINLANENQTIFYYPDVIVSCDTEDQDRYFLNYPCLIIEVLSPSTETIDRREKLLNYRSLASLKEYVLISQDQVKVEVYRQDEKRNWTIQTLINRDDKLHLDSVGLILEMTDIYEDVINVAIM
jgi:Uma2 family endonuclease